MAKVRAIMGFLFYKKALLPFISCCSRSTWEWLRKEWRYRHWNVTQLCGCGMRSTTLTGSENTSESGRRRVLLHPKSSAAKIPNRIAHLSKAATAAGTETCHPTTCQESRKVYTISLNYFLMPDAITRNSWTSPGHIHCQYVCTFTPRGIQPCFCLTQIHVFPDAQLALSYGIHDNQSCRIQ